MALINTEGFIIRSIKYGESDRIVDFFTHHEGKITVIAKNVRKIKKRFNSTFELLDHLSISYFKKEGKEIYSLSSADFITSITRNEPDLQGFAVISFFTEIVREFCPSGEANSNIFSLLLWIQNNFSENVENLTIVDIFILQLLHFSGFSPQVDCCSLCFAKVNKIDYYFSNRESGLICSKCIPVKIEKKLLNQGMIKFIEKVYNSNFNLLSRLKLSKKGSIYLFAILESYIQTILEKKLKTTLFLMEINS